MTYRGSMNAKAILEMLRRKHEEDVFVSECKDGPSWGGMKRMDAWVMKKSWSNPLSIVYEIKVSRNDFLGDNKWPSYLPYCNQLYFICPSKIIMPDELPQEVGLMYVSKTGSRVFTKKKAPYRTVEIPESLYRYILMARCKIKSANNFRNDEAFWRNWMAEKEDRLNFGHMVSRRVSRIISEKIEEVKSDNYRLENENKKLSDIKEYLEKHGINLHGYNPAQSVRDRIGVPRELETQIERGITSLQNIQKILQHQPKVDP